MAALLAGFMLGGLPSLQAKAGYNGFMTNKPHAISLGIYHGEGESNLKQIEAIESKVEQKFPIIHVYAGFNEGFSSFKAKKLDKLQRDDSVFLISWAPGVAYGKLYPEIAKGRVDGYLTQWARGLRDTGKPVFIRFAYEMNMTNMAWNGTDANGGPESFKAAWQHIHQVFEKEGATNVKWVWCPHADTQSPNYTDLMTYYPGNDYVDWIGLDGYNWDTRAGMEGDQFDRVFKPAYQQVSGFNKPMMIAEMGTRSDTSSQDRWLQTAFQKIGNDYPKIHAVVYFDADFSQKGEKDWRFTTRAESVQVFKNVMNSPLFMASPQALLALN